MTKPSVRRQEEINEFIDQVVEIIEKMHRQHGRPGWPMVVQNEVETVFNFVLADDQERPLAAGNRVAQISLTNEDEIGLWMEMCGERGVTGVMGTGLTGELDEEHLMLDMAPRVAQDAYNYMAFGLYPDDMPAVH